MYFSIVYTLIFVTLCVRNPGCVEIGDFPDHHKYRFIYSEFSYRHYIHI